MDSCRELLTLNYREAFKLCVLLLLLVPGIVETVLFAVEGREDGADRFMI